jgi:hypothetical protein
VHNGYVRILIALALLGAAAGAAPPNPAIVSHFKALDPGLAGVHTVFRHTLPDGDRLLVARASRTVLQDNPKLRWFWWGRGDLLGLFLESGGDPGRVRPVGTLPPALADYAMTVDRVDGRSTVFSRREGDYGLSAPSLKIFFDLRTGRLGKVAEYPPAAVLKLFRQNGRLCFLTSGGKEPAVWRMDGNGPVRVPGAAAGRVPAGIHAVESTSNSRRPSWPTGRFPRCWWNRMPCGPGC